VTPAAIVTGASRGIGLAIAHALAADGYDLTLTARHPGPLEQAAEDLRALGRDVHSVAADVVDAQGIGEVVDRHRARFGRLDILVNNAGIGIAAPLADQSTRHVDLQLAVNLRATILFYQACAEMLRRAGAEHGRALVVNLASFAGKFGQARISVYSAAKAGVVAYTQAMNKELSAGGVKSVALCPGFVDTDMSDFAAGRIDPQDMVRPQDVAEAVRFLLRVSPACVVPEIMLHRRGDVM
jgi:NAD(P)-dependent dehydrogenase (short-subunit alcohol dehydrogenase family)